jgi:hypothetical protein
MKKWLEYSIPELFSISKCHGLGTWLMDQRRGGWFMGPPWTPPVVDGKGSPELGLVAAPDHGGSPRGWRRDGHDTAPPGDYSPELG